MSRKGGRDGVKDGGAHGSTHETSPENEFLVTGTLFDNESNLNPQNDHNGTSAPCIQNGGSSEQVSCVGVGDLLVENESNLDSFTSMSVNNVEWLKGRCKSLDIVDFDCVNGKENDCGSVGELFPDPGRVEEGGGVDLESVGSSQGNDAVRQIVIEPLDTSASVDDVASQGVMVHFGETSDLKNRQEEFPLQTIMQHFNLKDSVSLMTPQELELLPNRGLEFDDSFVSVASSYQASDGSMNTSSKSDVNSISYEGNVKKEMTGISSDTTVLTKTVDNKSSSNIELVDKKVSATTTTTNTSDLSGGISNASGAVGSVTAVSSESQETNKMSEVQSDQANLTLATISISTDKTANSTQILVNTNHGQQLYLINTADLTQATNALQPLAESNTSNKAVLPEAAPQPVTPPTPVPAAPAETKHEVVLEQPSPIQAMPLQIQNTGYLLLPVAQQEGSNGIILTTPLTALPSELPCQSRKIWICQEDGCDKVFRKLSKLKVHQMRHTGERPFKCSRSGCDWAFTTAYKLKRHEESHEGRKDYTCDYPRCGRKFTTVYNLNSHKRIHERPCTEACPEPECDQKFPTKRQLDLHIRTHTGLEKTYKCPVAGCEKVFFSPNCMGSHARIHLQDRQDLVCKFEGCGKVFDKRCRLKQHERRHTGEKPYVCQFPGCNWAFPTASKLKRHKAKHTGVRKWVCNICNKGFMRAEHLKGHLVTHSGVKPFVCPVEGCKARFTAKSSLYVHLKKHDASGKKVTYHCPMEGCERNYSSKAGLRNHILKHFLLTPSGSDPSAALDWVPLLGGDEDGTLEKLVQSSAESGTSQSETASLAQSVLSSIQERNLTPSDFINPDGTVLATLTESDTDCLNTNAEQLSSTIVKQLISSSPLSGEAEVVMDTQEHQLGQLSKIEEGSAGSSPVKAQSTIAIASEKVSVATVCLENQSGSARTDYRSNHMLSERAKRRWHRVKLEDEDSIETDITSTDGIESGVSDPGLPLFPSPDILSSSQGVMFRDPETGLTYVQTQLLQDDPPHPALYDEESGGTSVTGAVSFTGTTINLQDLK